MISLSVLAGAVLAAVLFGEDVQMPAAAIAVPATTETLVATGNSITLPSSNGKGVIRGWLALTVGAGTTAVTVAIYRGAQLGGPLVGVKNTSAGDFTPGSTATFSIECIDRLSEVSGAQYCMSVQQVEATADGIVLSALIDSKVLSG